MGHRVDQAVPDDAKPGKCKAQHDLRYYILTTITASSLKQMPETSRLILDGYEYQIVEAEIVAAISDPYWCDTHNSGHDRSICWGIHIETDSDDDDRPPPSVEFNWFQGEFKNWHELAGYQSKWTEPINPDTGKRYGLIYVYDHQLITSGGIRITTRNGSRFHIVATGQNEEGQILSIDAPADFKGIYVHGSESDSDESIRSRLRKYIDDVNLSGTPFLLEGKYDSGIGRGESFFSPILD